MQLGQLVLALIGMNSGLMPDHRFLFHSDNQAVIHILNARTSKDPSIMRLLRNLLSSAAHFNFSFHAQHIPSLQNKIADALSRFNWQTFWLFAPQAQVAPSQIPHQLLEDWRFRAKMPRPLGTRVSPHNAWHVYFSPGQIHKFLYTA